MQVAGRILWCRQLFRKAEAPMLILKKKLDVLKVPPDFHLANRHCWRSVRPLTPPCVCQGPEMTRAIRSYNKTAALLLQYELLHLQSWQQAAEGAPRLLSAALLVRREDSKVLVMSQ